MDNIKLEYISKFIVSKEELFRWHESSGAFERLNPPWDPVKVISSSGGIKDGAVVHLKIPIFLNFGIRWILTHLGYVKGEKFEDVQIKGPFSFWHHKHLFIGADDNTSVLKDQISFSLPVGVITNRIFGSFFIKKLDRLFKYRHRITINDLKVIAKYKNNFQESQNILISGASGFVGKSLVGFLTLAGHNVYCLVRKKSEVKDSKNIFWDPYKKEIDLKNIPKIDYVINLSGENIAKRWSSSVKENILKSRVTTTEYLSSLINSKIIAPKAFINASASGFYGFRQTKPMIESDSFGEGFLAEVSRKWEEACQIDTAKVDTRVCIARISVVLSPEGGALKKLLLPFLLGAGGPIDTGNNFMSCISKDDLIYGIYHCIATNSVNGPVNFSIPQEVTNLLFSKVLAKTLKRPCFFPTPSFLIKLIFGEMAKQTILSSTNIYPKKLLETGFEFSYSDIESSIRSGLGL